MKKIFKITNMINFLFNSAKQNCDNLQILNITKKQIKDICPIYVRYRQSANVKSCVSEVKAYLNTEFSKNTDYILAAQINNQIVGFLHYCTETSTLRPASRIVLKAMFVDTEYRRCGIAKTLISQLQQHTKINEIRVKARRTNHASPNLYLQNGFTEDIEYTHLVYRKEQ